MGERNPSMMRIPSGDDDGDECMFACAAQDCETMRIEIERDTNCFSLQPTLFFSNYYMHVTSGWERDGLLATVGTHSPK